MPGDGGSSRPPPAPPPRGAAGGAPLWCQSQTARTPIPPTPKSAQRILGSQARRIELPEKWQQQQPQNCPFCFVGPPSGQISSPLARQPRHARLSDAPPGLGGLGGCSGSAARGEICSALGLGVGVWWPHLGIKNLGGCERVVLTLGAAPASNSKPLQIRTLHFALLLKCPMKAPGLTSTFAKITRVHWATALPLRRICNLLVGHVQQKF